jgi:hypothetical protein
MGMNRFILLICIQLLLALKVAMGQTPPSLPDRTGTLKVTQALNFGDITLKSATSSGTVTVNYNGVRSSTGDVILLTGTTAKPAIFEFKLCPGRTVIITYSSTVSLTGSNGGSMLLHIGPTNYGASGAAKFTSNKGCDDLHSIKVGGTIDVSAIATNPAGSYTGDFELIFNQQ